MQLLINKNLRTKHSIEIGDKLKLIRSEGGKVVVIKDPEGNSISSTGQLYVGKKHLLNLGLSTGVKYYLRSEGNDLVVCAGSSLGKAEELNINFPTEKVTFTVEEIPLKGNNNFVSRVVDKAGRKKLIAISTDKDIHFVAKALEDDKDIDYVIYIVNSDSFRFI